MIVFKRHTLSIMVMYAILLHAAWAILILMDSSAMNATAVHAIAAVFVYPTLTALVIGGASLLACVGLWTRRPSVMLLLLPQQVVLMMSAAGAIEAMWLSQFADGVLRPWQFIAADQLYSVVAAIGHTIAIIAHAMDRKRGEK